ncbi:IPT/TIG domain-containing protein [Corallococcus aberystwythensis]|uniref:IPT/TIG domain-containing protein n=1 Tax=Corallococcus aberystwythensis TaxID=2316722 RepID=UPI0013151C85|nr:IPT/TIG domain-containing protein [Corallococcus aberystwythensis]
MRLPVAAALLSLVACTESTEGTTPKLEGLINPLQRLVTPARVCNAGGGAAGWRLELIGSRFTPVPRDALTDTPSVELPRISLSGPSDYTLPEDHLFFARTELMRMDLPTRDSTPSNVLPPGTYTVAVTNPLGGTSELEGALRVVPPPVITSITAPQGFHYSAGSPLVIEGSGFRSDALPLIVLQREGEEDQPLFTLTVVSDTRIETEVPPATPEGTYAVTLTNPEGCAVTRPQALTVAYAPLGTLSVSPRGGPANSDTAVTLTSTAAAFTDGTGTHEVYLVAPVKTDPGQTVNIPLYDVTYVSSTQLKATVPTCSGFDARPVTDPTCPGGIVPGTYGLIVADPSGAFGTLPASSGFTVSP